MSKKQLEPIIEYLKLIGCRPLNSAAQGYEFMDRIFGSSEETDRVVEQIQKRAEKSSNALGHMDFYDFKNETYERSWGISLCYDNLFLREAGRVLGRFKDSFGKRILDVGCDNGVLSCFLAFLCPDSQILAIDRCEKATEYGRRLAERIGLKNICFKAVDVSDVAERYDTVFTSRTAQENMIDRDYPAGKRYREKAEVFKTCFSGYAEVVSSKISEQGNLIAISRESLSVRYLGRLFALADQSLALSKENWRSLRIHDPKAPPEWVDEFQIAIFRHAEIDSDAIFNRFAEFVEDSGLNLSAKSYEGDLAEFMFMRKAGALLTGKCLFLKENNSLCGECSIWADKDDSEGIWMYVNNNGDYHFDSYRIAMRDKLEADLNRWIDNSVAQGLMRSEDMAGDRIC